MLAETYPKTCKLCPEATNPGSGKKDFMIPSGQTPWRDPRMTRGKDPRRDTMQTTATYRHLEIDLKRFAGTGAAGAEGAAPGTEVPATGSADAGKGTRPPIRNTRATRPRRCAGGCTDSPSMQTYTLRVSFLSVTVLGYSSSLFTHPPPRDSITASLPFVHTFFVRAFGVGRENGGAEMKARKFCPWNKMSCFVLSGSCYDRLRRNERRLSTRNGEEYQ